MDGNLSCFGELSATEKADCALISEKLASQEGLIFRRRPKYGLLVFVSASCLFDPAFGTGELILVSTVLLASVALLVSQLSMLTLANQILLTPQSLTVTRRTPWARSVFSIPWDRVDATQESSSFPGCLMSLLADAFAPDCVLCLQDKSSGKTRRYRAATIRNYPELRAALISLVGLRETLEAWENM
jgi:hypothetical protein